jgi:phosphoglycolate phosphatase-like HAD superfamily hydrolase
MKAIIFDLDGTLFQTEKVGIPAFRETFRVLREKGELEGGIPSDEQIESVFGLTHEEIWERLLPGANEELKQKVDRLMLEKELEMLAAGEGALYPGVEETLRALHAAGWPLFIASNGVDPYVKGVLASKGLLSLFRGIYTAGSHGTSTKAELVNICLRKHAIHGGFMVGDRRSDVEAGKANGLVAIGCRYTGFRQFGSADELEEADVILESFPDLLSMVTRD